MPDRPRIEAPPRQKPRTPTLTKATARRLAILDDRLSRLEALTARVEAVLGQSVEIKQLMAEIAGAVRRQTDQLIEMVELHRRDQDDRPEWLRDDR